MEDLLTLELFGVNLATPVLALIAAGGGVVVALIVRWGASAVVRRHAAKSAVETGEPTGPARYHFVLRMVQSFIFPAIVLAGFYVAVTLFGFEGQTEAVISAFFVVLFSLVTIRFFVAIVNELFRRAADEKATVDLIRVRPLRAIAIFAIWIAGLLFLLDNLGFDVTAVVAGLGIGGIAVALAAQALLGDMFAYFVILFDKPFELGDFLAFGDILGSVERIGVKTTRLRSLGGEQIIVANADLTNSRVRNYKRMSTRRVEFNIDVVYGTDAEHIRAIPAIIREVISAEELAVFDRAHFAKYGEWSLVFTAVYNVASPDFNLYMDIQERINLGIYDRFNEEGIEFAFPTQTIVQGHLLPHDTASSKPAAAREAADSSESDPGGNGNKAERE